MFSRKTVLLVITLCILAAPLAIAYAAGGAISGTITDPKGAVIVGATVTVIDPISAQTYFATTDKDGRYKVEKLPAGSYVVTVSAKGFADVRRENIAVEEDKSTTLDLKLEVGAVEETVNVSAGTAKGNTDSIYQQLRQSSVNPNVFDGPYATVSNLVLKRDAATFILRSGEVYFSPTVEGHRTGAVFIGDGEMTMTPPTDTEKRQLAVFIDKQTLTEEFTQLVLHFTDQTFDEIKASPNVRMGENGAQAAHARDLYRENESYVRKELRTNLELRTLTDLYSTVQRPGFFIAFINGRHYSKLAYQIDPLGTFLFAPEQVMLNNYDPNAFGFWSSFHMAEEYRKGTATSSQNRRLYDVKHHEIDGLLRGSRISVTDEISLRANVSGTRVLPFNLLPSLRVTGVKDEQGRELDFIQENKNEDADFAVIIPAALSAGSNYKLTIQYEGEGAVTNFGGGNFALNAGSRTNWYPNNGNAEFGHRSTFTITFRYPKGYTFIGVGARTVPDVAEDKYMVTKWTSGETELAVAGFNYGKFKMKEALDKETGYNVEFYANTTEAPGIRNRQTSERMQEMETGKTIEQSSEGQRISTNSGNTTGAADVAIAQTQVSMRLYNEYYGKLPYTRIAMSQQPYGSFGQSWPTLVYMPYLAFLDQTTLMQMFGARRVSRFNKYIAPHEVAHQWWGHIVGWSSYRDQWMSEGFAEFSASLYVQNVIGLDKYIEFWDSHRKRLVESSPSTNGRKPYTLGPMTQGLRLRSEKTGDAYTPLVYDKGPYILHMLRWMMYDRNGKDNDARFKAMMRDLVQTYYNKDVTTEDFKRVVDKHMTREMDLAENGRMDWFFDQWVYGTEIPAYKFEYQVTQSGGKTLFSGRITQSGVSDDFRMLVPVWVDFGKGWVRLGSATIVGNTSVELNNIALPKEPKKAAICALDDVLATSIENVKK